MTNAKIQQRFEYYENFFDCTPEMIRECYEAFLTELQRGLEMHAHHPTGYAPNESSLMMLDTCVEHIPTGKEKGVYYAIDFGGTNVRTIRCKLDGTSNVQVEAQSCNIRNIRCRNELENGLLDKHATASMLFDVFANSIGEMIKKDNPSEEPKGVGFTFSFPISQGKVNSARLLSWTKDFATGNETNDPVVGRDVGALLDAAFIRKQVNAKTVVVLNDTVGCILAGSVAKAPELPPCLVGMILGTGVNACYVQRNAKKYGYKGIVVNTELGNFNKCLPRNVLDYAVDYNAKVRGRQLLEKAISGMYLPELTRLFILRVFEHETPKPAWTPFSLSGEGCSIIFNYPERVAEVLETEWNWKVTDPTHLQIIHKAAYAVYRRSAMISAAVIAALCKQTGFLQPAMGGVTVGIDGTLYVKNKQYQNMISEYLKWVVDDQLFPLIKIIVAEDGSGRGAAILAGTILNAVQKVT